MKTVALTLEDAHLALRLLSEGVHPTATGREITHAVQQLSKAIVGAKDDIEERLEQKIQTEGTDA